MNQPALIDIVPRLPLSGARLSPDEVYRYTLDRVWDTTLPRAVFVMLNPSTADARVNDPTIVRCRGFAEREGCGSLSVVNLYALRATDPAELKDHPDPVGPENAFYLRSVITQNPRLVIAAWGAHRMAAARVPALEEILRDPLTGRRIRLMCLGTTKSGAPRHPLYVRRDQPLTPLGRAS